MVTKPGFERRNVSTIYSDLW